ncbi:MAG: NarK/NasA family nitrate transporter [Deltaproteobacteria bacterium]|nr:NarK/NasA family nitrate transporter [Deltaproteobacteria bacterium]
MMNFKAFMKSGHPPTLFCAFLYFDFCFAIWVMNGAMAPFISEQFHLTPMEKGFMLSVPVLAGALMRFPTGLLAQYITRKWAAMFEMALITVGLIYGYFFVDSYTEVIYMGIPLGIAGASFGVALSLGGGWFPPKYKGLAIGIAGAGNSGAVIAMLFAPPLAVKYGWSSVYGYAIILMLIPMALMLFFAKEPPDLERKKLSDYLKILVEKDAWVFNIIYIVSFGGYIGFTMFLPTFFHDQFGIPKSQMGQYAAVIAIMASVLRITGGWAADRWGGVRMLNVLLILIAVGAFAVSFMPSVLITTAILILIFSALGAANGSTFQLVPLRFAYATPIAMSLVGEVGALGGGLLPNAMGVSKQYLGSFSGGFIFFGAMSLVALVVLRVVQRRWTTSWVGEGGKALHHEEKAYEA